MLWEIEIRPRESQVDREAQRVLAEASALGTESIRRIHSGRSFLVETDAPPQTVVEKVTGLVVDPVVETCEARQLPANGEVKVNGARVLNVLFKPGVTDLVAKSAQQALTELGLDTSAVATCRKYWLNEDCTETDANRLASRVLSNDAIEQVVAGPLQMTSLALGSEYHFELLTVPIRTMDDDALMVLSREGQLYLNLEEMQQIQSHFQSLDRDPTDIELETVAQTWSEHCSHKTLAGRIRYQDGEQEILFENMLKETIFAATQQLRQQWGNDDWCVSVFKDNAGIVTFDDTQNVCFKVETHNHPSALEPYGGANTGIGGVIRDPLGTGMGARPVCNTDVFCFAPPDTSFDSLPPGVLHPKAVMQGVVSGVRDYGNRMGIPTVNGAVYFDERYLGNPLVYCGNVAMIPIDQCEKHMQPGDLIVAVGGRTGRDGIHGATFSSAELTEESETLSGGAVQIGNPVTEKMVADVILEARDRGLYTSITDCGAGGFSSAVGEMGEETGAEVWLERCPLKYEGLSYTEIWISEAQERMVLAVPEQHREEFIELCASEGVEATVIGKFTDTHNLVLKYNDQTVGELSMEFLHDGRPPTIRDAVYEVPEETELNLPTQLRFDDDLKSILGSLNVASKEWIIRQYDHEVQAGSVVKPLVGVQNDGPSDAAVIRPDLHSDKGLVISCGMNPLYGELDTYWMAASAIDEAVRNCVAVGADPHRIAILDNFCWGKTDKPEVLGSLVRAAVGCHDTALAFQTPFVSGKDSLNNEFVFTNDQGEAETVTIPASLLISALGQMDDVSQAVTMDLKQPGNRLYLFGQTLNELGGSHYSLIHNLAGGQVPQVQLNEAPILFQTLHQLIQQKLIGSCHDLSEGGLAVALAEMSFAGGYGIDAQLDNLVETTGLTDAAVLLFSESNTRFVLEVSEENAAELESQCAGLPLTQLGSVTADDRISIQHSGQTVIDIPWSDCKAAWQKPLAW